MSKTKRVLKPLIKYTGGKFREYKYFEEFIPDVVNDYYEPFFGGGGVFFQMHNNSIIKGCSYINDISTDLMNFYSCIMNKGLTEELYKLADVWDDVLWLGSKINMDYGDLFFEIIVKEKEVKDMLNNDFVEYLDNLITNETEKLSIYDTHGFSLTDKIVDGLKSKLSRFRNKNISTEDNDVAYNCITTSICQSFYFIVRDMYNDWLLNPSASYTQLERSAQWFFIREYCFGSMFRFGADGKFNIPYGGLSYNSKCIRCKVEEIASKETQDIFSKVKIFSEDFDKFMKRKFDKNDFIFLDPPYDSTFSEYDNNSFTQEDHKRLKQRLDSIKCKWMLVIRKTDFINDLYKDYEKIEYMKTYAYQAKGQYDSKNSIHLIIKNY